MKVDFASVKDIVLDLISSNKRELAFSLLDYYFTKASDVGDYDALGHAALKSDYRDLYLKCAERAYAVVETTEQKYIARTNLYRAYNALNYPEKALFYIDLNLKYTPNDFESLVAKASNLAIMGKKQESEELLVNLGNMYPDKKDKLRGGFSNKLMREGKPAEGILAYLDAWEPKSKLFQAMNMTPWDGVYRPGEQLYIETEGGFGDEFINIRFFKHLQNMGMEPILYSPYSSFRNETIDLFKRMGYNVLTDQISIDKKVRWATLLALPGRMGIRESQLWTGPYFKALRNPKNDLKSDKFKIGIKCSGNPYFAQDAYRCIPVEEMLAIMPEGVEVYYIDKDKEVPGTISVDIDTWEDTLDIIDQMDCIVSSCTSLVHAAGAMGKRTYVATPIGEYYIWGSTKEDKSNPWYGDNFQVHKQTKLRSWKEPLASIQQELQKLVSK